MEDEERGGQRSGQGEGREPRPNHRSSLVLKRGIWLLELVGELFPGLLTAPECLQRLETLSKARRSRLSLAAARMLQRYKPRARPEATRPSRPAAGRAADPSESERDAGARTGPLFGGMLAWFIKTDSSGAAAEAASTGVDSGAYAQRQGASSRTGPAGGIPSAGTGRYGDESSSEEPSSGGDGDGDSQQQPMQQPHVQQPVIDKFDDSLVIEDAWADHPDCVDEARRRSSIEFVPELLEARAHEPFASGALDVRVIRLRSAKERALAARAIHSYREYPTIDGIPKLLVHRSKGIMSIKS